MLGVSAPSVVNWIDAGRLDAHRTPGGHRRISRSSLHRFATENQYPLPGAAGEAPARARHGGVLVLDPEPDFAALVHELLGVEDAELPVWTATDLLSAGLLIGRHGPTVVVADIAMPGLDPVAFARRLLADPETRDIRLVGLTACIDPPLSRRASEGGFAVVKSKADDLQTLVADVRRLLSDGS